MFFNNNERIGRFENEDVFVSTVIAFDTNRAETAIAHNSYNNGELIIVEEYDTREDAEVGHNKWVDIMTSDGLPDKLEDVSTSVFSLLAKSFSNNDFVFDRNKDDLPKINYNDGNIEVEF